MASVQPLSFGDLLRRYRLGAGLTQEELAERAGLSVKAIGALESGVRRTPRRETVKLLAKALGLTATEQSPFEFAARQRLSSVSQATGALGAAMRNQTPGRSGPVLVGRQVELIALDRHLDGEGPPLLMLAGEPGIGKSRLLEEAARRAPEQGWTVLADGCHRHSGQEPYAPFVAALARYLSTRPPAQQRLDLRGCAWLVRLLPELAELRIVPAPLWTLSPEQERRLMFAAVARLMLNVAGAAGTLLVLDDLHWAGADALELLAALLRETGPRPLRIIGAYRDTDIGPRDPLPLLLGDLVRVGRASRRSLSVLNRDEARELLSGLLVREHDERQAQFDDVLDRAGGHPYFLVSWSDELRAGTDLADAALPTVPWSAAESIRQRVALLPEAARNVLAVAAVAGRQVSHSVLLAAAKGSGQDEAQILAGLDSACRSRLLSEARDGLYHFTHDLIHEIVVADLGGARRVVLHRHVAEALEALPLGVRQAAELAWHFSVCDEPTRALPYALQAADQAEAMYAHAEAERQYAEAIKIARLCGDRVCEASALERRGNVRYRLARFVEAVSDLDAAAVIYRGRGDWERLVWATTQRVKAGDALGQAAESLVRIEALATTLAAAASPGGGEGRAPTRGVGSLAERMEQAASILTPGTAARLYLSLTSRMVLLGRLDEVPWTSGRVEAFASMASAAAREEGPDQLRLQGMERPVVMQSLVFSFRASALRAQGRLPEAAATLEDAVRLARECRDIDALGLALATLADVHERLGERGRAKEILLEMLAVAREYEDARYACEMEWRLGQIALVEGEWEEACRRFEHAALTRDEPGASETGVYAQSAAICLAWMGVLQGCTSSVNGAPLAVLNRALEPNVAVDLRRLAARALVERDLVTGKTADAEARLRTVLDIPVRHPTTQVLGLMTLQAWAYLQCGAVRQAEELLREAAEQAHAAQDEFAELDVLHVRSLLALHEERWEEAGLTLEELLRRCRQAPYPWLEAKALFVLGQLRAATQEPAVARKTYEQALAICARLGERLYANEIERAVADLA